MFETAMLMLRSLSTSEASMDFTTDQECLGWCLEEANAIAARGDVRELEAETLATVFRSLLNLNVSLASREQNINDDEAKLIYAGMLLGYADVNFALQRGGTWESFAEASIVRDALSAGGKNKKPIWHAGFLKLAGALVSAEGVVSINKLESELWSWKEDAILGKFSDDPELDNLKFAPSSPDGRKKAIRKLRNSGQLRLSIAADG